MNAKDYRAQQVPFLHQGYVTDFNEQFVSIGSKGADSVPGAIGQIFSIANDALATQYSSNPTANPLYPGLYRIVKVKTGITLAFGQLLYWDDRVNNVVTNVIGNDFAGVAACLVGTALFRVYMVEPVEGNNAQMLFVNGTTKGAPAVGDIAVASGTAGQADVLADATNVTWSTNKPLARLESTINGTSFLAKVKFGVK